MLSTGFYTCSQILSRPGGGKYSSLFHTGHFQLECEFDSKREMPSLPVSVKESFHADVITLFLHFVGTDIKSKAFSFFSENEREAE